MSTRQKRNSWFGAGTGAGVGPIRSIVRGLADRTPVRESGTLLRESGTLVRESSLAPGFAGIPSGASEGVRASGGAGRRRRKGFRRVGNEGGFSLQRRNRGSALMAAGMAAIALAAAGVVPSLPAQTPHTVRISVNRFGEEGNNDSRSGYDFDRWMSADGRFVVFESLATNLDVDENGSSRHPDGNDTWDIFVHDRDVSGNGVLDESGDIDTRMLSYSRVTGHAANAGSASPTISRNPPYYVTFGSNATDLLPAGSGTGVAYVCDLQTDALVIVSVNCAGVPGGGGAGGSFPGPISDDGHFVALFSGTTNLECLAPCQDTNNVPDTFLHNRRVSGNGPFDVPGNIDTVRATVHLVAPDCLRPPPDCIEANNISYASGLSGDGRFLAFLSVASNLVCNDTNGAFDCFSWDRDTREISRLNVRAPNKTA